jgi:hypothetical protein
MKIFKTFLLFAFLVVPFTSAHAKVLIDMSDFKNWRDADSNPGFNAQVTVDKENNYSIIALTGDKKFGKVMSSQKGLTVKIEEKTKFYIKLKEDIQDGSITVNLMTAGEPYDAHKLIAAKDKRGVYSARIADKTPWFGEYTFWIEIWLGGDNDPEAVISSIKITDGKKTIAKTKVKKRGMKRYKKIKKK